MEKENADICIRSRYEHCAEVHRGLWRRIFSDAYMKTVQVLFNCPVSDFQCGFKAFKKMSFLPILKEFDYDATLKRGWLFDAEFLIRSYRKGLQIITIPVVWNCNRKGSFQF
jgi:dolichyl-phosphate beta-glucosyltransferase